MRLDFAQALAVDQLETRHAVSHAPLVELFEARQLTIAHRHDHLAAPVVRDAVRLAEGRHQPHPLDAQARPGRAGTVVDACVDDAAVVPRLVRGDAGFLLEHGDAQARAALRQGEGRRQADDPPADDPDIKRLGAHRCGLKFVVCQRSLHAAHTKIGRHFSSTRAPRLARAAPRFGQGQRRPEVDPTR